nr:hypothetical protein CFP56_19674 [Quercus suber]
MWRDAAHAGRKIIVEMLTGSRGAANIGELRLECQLFGLIRGENVGSLESLPPVVLFPLLRDIAKRASEGGLSVRIEQRSLERASAGCPNTRASSTFCFDPISAAQPEVAWTSSANIAKCRSSEGLHSDVRRWEDSRSYATSLEGLRGKVASFFVTTTPSCADAASYITSGPLRS